MLQSLMYVVEELLTSILFKKISSNSDIDNFSLRFLEEKKNSVLLLKYLFCTISWCVFISISLDLVGFPPLSELKRHSSIGAGFFHPDISLIHGITKDDVLNIIFFVPLGFLLPLFWQGYRDVKKTAIFGLGFSLFLETSQLFNFYRWSEVNDLIMNTLGIVIGWHCFSLLSKKVKIIDYFLVTENENFSEPIIFTLVCILLEFLLAEPLF